MKKTSAVKDSKISQGEMLREYSFDYRKARPNRFAGRSKKMPMMVMVDPDIAQIFTTPKSVNEALRALITAIPKGVPRKKRTQQK